MGGIDFNSYEPELSCLSDRKKKAFLSLILLSVNGDKHDVNSLMPS